MYLWVRHSYNPFLGMTYLKLKCFQDFFKYERPNFFSGYY